VRANLSFENVLAQLDDVAAVIRRPGLKVWFPANAALM